MADRRALLLLVGTAMLEAAAIVAAAYVAKLLIDRMVTGMESGATTPALTLIGIELSLMVAALICRQGNVYVRLLLRHRLGLHANLLYLGRAADAAFHHFEDPAFADRMALIQSQGGIGFRAYMAVGDTSSLARHAVMLIGSCALLLAAGPAPVVALAVLSALTVVIDRRHNNRISSLRGRHAMRGRKTAHLEQILTGAESIKEVKLFGLGPWLLGRYQDVYEGTLVEEIAISGPHFRRVALIEGFGTVLLYGTLALLVMSAIRGQLTLGTVTLTLVAFRQGQGALKSVVGTLTAINGHSVSLATFFEFLDAPVDDPAVGFEDAEAPTGPIPEIEFRGVSFAYPGTERLVLEDISFRIAPGESIALVGPSGAGKTTLVKLLVGLYTPTSGAVLIDGRDVRDIPPAELRVRIGAVFQDFVRYFFSAADNVAAGWLPARDDRRALEEALDRAGLGSTIAALAHGLETELGRTFGGTELSGGQWQRLALARAFLRKSQILILDEPTSALDAEAEARLIEMFRELRRRQTTILITHRLASVRVADRIVVLANGRVAEIGSARELLSSDGLFARLYRLQATGFLAEPPRG